MPVYNGERFLEQAVASVRNQSFREWELIVVDDGSTDATAAILSRHTSEDARVRVYHEHHRGLIDALNFGCGMARSQYLARMDADDVAMPQRLEQQLVLLEANKRLGVVGSAIRVIDGCGNPLFQVTYPTTDVGVRRSLVSGNAFAHPTVMMRRTVFEGSGGYRHPFLYGEDYDLWLRMSVLCEFANTPRVLLDYRFHSAGASSQEMSHQVLVMVAAAISAELRRSGQVDTIARLERVTLAHLLDIAPSRTDVLNRIVELSAGRSGFLVRVNRPDDALRLLGWADHITGQMATGRARAKASVLRAAAWHKKGSFWRCLGATLEAFRSDPVRAAQIFTVGLLVLLRDAVASSPIRMDSGTSARGFGQVPS
jgi:hypothetical protein